MKEWRGDGILIIISINISSITTVLNIVWVGRQMFQVAKPWKQRPHTADLVLLVGEPHSSVSFDANLCLLHAAETVENAVDHKLWACVQNDACQTFSTTFRTFTPLPVGAVRIQLCSLPTRPPTYKPFTAFPRKFANQSKRSLATVWSVFVIGVVNS